MHVKKVKWEIINNRKDIGKKRKSTEEIINILLENRGLKNTRQKGEFFEPKKPDNISLKELGINTKSTEKAVNRIIKAINKNEQIIIYGDYDADGICATAILWETIFKYTKKALPYIPDRFIEGYGINKESIEKLKSDNNDLKLIITVDNGITANDAVSTAKKLGIDVIITDHHTKGKITPSAHSIVHTTKTSGSGVSWFFAREISKKIDKPSSVDNKLELAAIGTIADQLPLIEINRSIAKFGLKDLRHTKRVGLKTLFKKSGIINTRFSSNKKDSKIGTYEVNFIIAPRINAMGRMEHAIDSLRLLCTKNEKQAEKLANLLEATNKERQKVVENVVMYAEQQIDEKKSPSAIVLAHESYHEGVIGLAAGRLAEKYYLPTIVISKGKNISKASARSISGFNIIESILELSDLIEGGGGHPMAAGFSIKTKNISVFQREFRKITQKNIKGDISFKKVRIDCQLNFSEIDDDFYQKLMDFQPSGIGNPTPIFISDKVRVLQYKTVGYDNKHLKLTLEKEGKVIEAIGFNLSDKLKILLKTNYLDICYVVDENEWNGNKSLQLKLRDIKPSTN